MARRSCRAAIEAARRFLAQELEHARAHLVQDLRKEVKHFWRSVSETSHSSRGRHDLEQTIARWDRMHHLTIKAVCRRGGSHVGVRTNDFSTDLSKPILDGIAFAWSDFFGDRLQAVLEKWTDHLILTAGSYHESLS